MIGVGFPHLSLDVGLDRGRLSRAGSAVTLEVPRPGRRCLRGAFSANSPDCAPRKPGCRCRVRRGNDSGVTAAPGATGYGQATAHAGAAVSGAGAGAGRGRRRSRAHLSSGLPGKRRAGPAFAQEPQNSSAEKPTPFMQPRLADGPWPVTARGPCGGSGGSSPRASTRAAHPASRQRLRARLSRASGSASRFAVGVAGKARPGPR